MMDNGSLFSASSAQMLSGNSLIGHHLLAKKHESLPEETHSEENQLFHHNNNASGPHYHLQGRSPLEEQPVIPDANCRVVDGQEDIKERLFDGQTSESGPEFGSPAGDGGGGQETSGLTSHYGACNPHGIDTILSRRRTPNTSVPEANSPDSMESSDATSFTSRLSSSLQSNPYFNASALSQLGSSCKLEDLQAAAAQAAAAGNSRASLYWPGIQGLISNPNVWRERLALNSKSSIERVSE